MPIDPEFGESLMPHRDCPTPRERGRDGRLAGRMVRLYYPNHDTLRWVPVGSMCLDCGLVQIFYRGRAQSP
jgi:hypothetical protein